MSCSRCDNGKVPFKRKDGSIVPYAWLDCSCKEDEPEHYQLLKPEDFDFPCSYDFRSFVEREYTGKSLPSIEPSEQVSRWPGPLLEPEWTQRQWQYVQQIRGQLNHLSNKVTELRATKRTEQGEY